jgi:hypothetical protein
MLNQEQVEKLEAWVDANPEAADTPYLNLSTGVQTTVRNMLNMAKASLSGELKLDPSLQAELDKIETWIGGL